MKVFSMSQRIYYKDLEPEAESIIKKDLELYNCGNPQLDRVD